MPQTQNFGQARIDIDTRSTLQAVPSIDVSKTFFHFLPNDHSFWQPITSPDRADRRETGPPTDPGRPNPTQNFYGAGRRVLRQTGYDGREFKFAYKLSGACVTNIANPGVKCTDGSCPGVETWENFQAGWRIHGGRVIGVTVTRPDGTQSTQSFNPRGVAQSQADTQGMQSTYKYDPQNHPTEIQDTIGRVWKNQYDAKGNLTQTVDAAGRVVNRTYDAIWNKVTSVTRFLPDSTPVVWQSSYNPATGTLASTTDPLGNVTSYAYTPRGELAGITVPGNRTTGFVYNSAGDLVQVTDPLGNQTTFQTDGAGRPGQTTDALGYATVSEYNGVDQLTRSTDALGQATRYTYDAAGRLASVIDPRANAIESYQYDSQDRLAARIDAVNKSETYQYDGAGRLAQVTDRRAQVTRFEYDQSNRLGAIVFPDATQNRVYDALGRLSEIREGANAVSTSYDVVGRVSKVTTDNASGRNEVAYDYDTLDRVVTRTVNGTDPTTYSYDNAGRPLTIGYRGQSTTYVWDTASRLTSKTLPNGIRQEFTYDDADRLLTLTYRKTDTTVLEQLAYSYDAKGQRLTKSAGTTSVPETPITAVYDTANRLTTLTLTATGQVFNLAYDDNGNLASKTEQGGAGAVTNYSWDARNRLIGISAPGLTAGFEYDALGRRASKTVNGQTVGFVYDGAQAIGEVTGGTISTAILTTLAIDDVVARYTSQGARTYLVDALGSVIAQAKDDQSIQNYYGYSAYGEAQTLGPDEGNAIQYTGREVDGTGLMFYRARYYDTVLKRFVSEDPIGLAGGGNFYAYVEENPVNYRDPRGLFASDVHFNITYRAARDSGMGVLDSMALAWGTVMTDKGTQGVDDAYIHSMTPKGMDPELARELRDQYVADQMRSGTPQGLANAIHAMQDSVGSAHAGFKEYSGRRSALTRDHQSRDWFPSRQEWDEAYSITKELIVRSRRICL